ncbi:hypothetical protein DAI22_09g099750 [Oryza sativa Japonica Group]|nr:hypothetical protein DAI22_09g099750 [Oryza sativa Japonica Group]
MPVNDQRMHRAFARGYEATPSGGEGAAAVRLGLSDFRCGRARERETVCGRGTVQHRNREAHGADCAAGARGWGAVASHPVSSRLGSAGPGSVEATWNSLDY